MAAVSDAGSPLLLIRGDATDEEVAALVAVLAALSRTTRLPARTPVTEWSAHHRRVRTTGVAATRPGPGGWRSSALPR